MTQDEAKAIIEREPVGGAHYYSPTRDRFYNHVCGDWFRFNGQWVECIPLQLTTENMVAMHEILAIALGDKND